MWLDLPGSGTIPFARDMALDPGGAIEPCVSGTTHVAFGTHDGLGLHNVVISWLNPIPHAITVYASDPASPRRPQHSLPGGSLRLTRTGLSPVGSRQLRLAHRVVTPRFWWREITRQVVASSGS